MTQINRMKYCVTQSGYSVQMGDGVTSQELDGGAPRYRRSIKGVLHAVSVQWIVDEAGYQYLTAFYRVWSRNPAQPFLCKLCIDNAPAEDYECFFSGGLKLSGKEARIYTVTSTLRVKPLNTNDTMDDLIVALGNDSVDFLEIKDPLNELVNQRLPDALEKIKDK